MTSSGAPAGKPRINWEAVTAIGQLVGALAVVVTLIYLTVQVRYAKLATSDANRLARAQGVCQMMLSGAIHSDIRNANIKVLGLDSFYEEVAQRLEVTPDEAAILDHTYCYWFWLHWGQFSSTNEEKDLDELRRMVLQFYAVPSVRMFWDASPTAKPMLDPIFVAFVEETLEETAGKPRAFVDMDRVQEGLEAQEGR